MVLFFLFVWISSILFLAMSGRSERSLSRACKEKTEEQCFYDEGKTKEQFSFEKETDVSVKRRKKRDNSLFGRIISESKISQEQRNEFLIVRAQSQKIERFKMMMGLLNIRFSSKVTKLLLLQLPVSWEQICGLYFFHRSRMLAGSFSVRKAGVCRFLLLRDAKRR